jgi:hypothetical protein
VNFFRSLCLAALCLALAACANSFRDDSRFVRLDAKRGYYVLQTGSPLALKLGYKYPPTSDTGDPLHRGYGNDVIAFRVNRSGVLVAPPAYFSQLPPDQFYTDRLAMLQRGATTWQEIHNLFPGSNWRIKQPDGGLLVYHDVPLYNPLEEDHSMGGGR